MHKSIVFALSAFVAGRAAAQRSAQPDPADATRPSPPVVYESAFKGYRPFVDPDLARWRDVNDEMGRLGGHVGHVPGSVPPRVGTGAPKPPAHMGHGGTR